MRLTLLLALVTSVALPVHASGQPSAAPAPHATVAIDGASRRLVAPELYGLFFEDINYGGEGGLYAELVRNRFFEETIVPPRCTVTAEGHLCNPGGWRSPFPVTDPLPGWRLLGPRTTATPAAQPLLHPARERSLRVTLAPGSDPAGLAALGFGGIAVRAGERYRLTVWARGSATFSAPLTATLVAPGASGASEIGGLSASGLETNLKSEIAAPHAAPAPLSAPAPLPALTADTWTRQDLELTATTTHPRAELHLTAPAGAEGTFWLGGVSLFPARTWQDRPNGLRLDLAEKLAALRPRFFRFPGGCVVEGFSRETAINWKHTLGPIEERRGHWSLWSYRDTSGLGYHEYLTLCEDLGADAMWVFNAGLSCQGRAPEVVPLDQLQPLVQDALDGIEYALGDVTTPWGARRAAAGHPAPFPLRYVSIGNENWGPDYETRYRVFHDAIRARYPGLQVIATSAVASAPVEILDEHFYPDPDFFIAHHDHYDDYPRTGPRIFVGEFASILNCGQGNLRAAIGEAAFLVGMERNPDLVRMAAYAPLFKNVFHPNPWNPDAIVFDTHRAYGTPSYHRVGRIRPQQYPYQSSLAFLIPPPGRAPPPLHPARHLVSPRNGQRPCPHHARKPAGSRRVLGILAHRVQHVLEEGFGNQRLFAPALPRQTLAQCVQQPAALRSLRPLRATSPFPRFRLSEFQRFHLSTRTASPFLTTPRPATSFARRHHAPQILAPFPTPPPLPCASSPSSAHPPSPPPAS